MCAKSVNASVLTAQLLGLIAYHVCGATFTVSTTNESGDGSLRAAIVAANGTPEANIILFDIAVSQPRIISLSSALPPISGALSIINDRPADQTMTVQRSANAGTPNFRIFATARQSSLLISGLVITNGFTTEAGGALRLICRRP